jgi:hypothetical protein
VILHHNPRVLERRIQIRHNSLKHVLCSLLPVLSGCHYDEEYRVLKSTADIQDEKAELMKAYRLYMAKYQDDAAKAKDPCEPYTQSLREIEVKQSHAR